MRVDGHGYSPAVLQRIVTAGARLHSFADAAFALGLTGLAISARHVQELTGRIGAELAAARDAQADLRRRRQLEPEAPTAPPAVAVEVDGGRLGTRAAGCGRGVHHSEGKEAKVACLVTLDSQEHSADPQPEPPEAFVQPRRIQRLVRQMKGAAGAAPAVSDADGETEEPAEVPSAGPAGARPGAPHRLVRTCLASMVNSRAFGPLMAAAAQARNFYAANRRAFVGDGQQYNWSIQRGYFPDFVPIADFLHVICYVFTAAYALTGDEAQRWARYGCWMRACWQGRVSEVIEELQEAQAGMGRPPPGEKVEAGDPRRMVAEAIGYLSNNTARMNYPEYRRQGLPVTSSLVESLVGEFNARVKGKQKYWNRPSGAEAILQVRAALLSEDGRLQRHFATRPGSPYRRRAA